MSCDTAKSTFRILVIAVLAFTAGYFAGFHRGRQLTTVRILAPPSEDYDLGTATQTLKPEDLI